jgi:Caspase domain/Domain of unknown function (DUF4384)
MKRRDFLERLAQAIATLGVADAGWLRLGDRYAHALAQSTGRKLALLVGINQYPSTPSLNGCLTDVAMQRELLVHRFGFKAADVLTLTDLQATRQQIETVFLEHLTQQAKSGDTIVFHFSGYGRRVFEEAGEKRAEGAEGAEGAAINYQFPSNSLVCADGEDFLNETLWLLLRSLSTRQIATFLDTSFGTPGKIFPGNLRVRSLPQTVTEQVNAAELAFQQQLQQDFLCKRVLNRPICGNRETFSKLTPTDSIPGVVMAAASPTQSAIEAAWNGFSAGLFTYALTQHLWEATPATTVQVSISRVSGTVEQLVGKEQQPQVSSQKIPQSALTNYLSQDPSISADGVVMAVEDKKIAQLWLAGLPPTVLAYLEVGSKLNLIPLAAEDKEDKRGEGESESTIQNPQSKIQNSPTPFQLQVRSRNGLVAKAQVVGDSGNESLQVGQLVQEAVRVLPRNIRLTIALDPSLERIERVDATSAFAAMPFVSLVTTGEQLADYVFGRVAPTKAESATSNVASPSSRYGLFTLDRQLIPNTSGEFGEAVKVAVHRLSPKLQTLLAAKIWRLTTNDGSSRLNVKVTLETSDPPKKVIVQRETLRSPQDETPTLTGQLKNARAGLTEERFAIAQASANNLPLTTPPDSIPSLAIGSHIQYRVQNHSDRPVYLLLLGLDTNKSAIALYCTQVTANSTGVNSKPTFQNIKIAPGETAIVPQSTANFTWTIHKPTGLAEHQLIFSSASFTETLAAMANTTKNFEEQEYIGTLSNPLEVVQAAMRDLQAASATTPQHLTASSDVVSPPADTYAFNVNNWASLSFVYQVVN